MSLSTDRQTFRQTVAAVAATAKAKLPQAVNGRVEAAVKLVLSQDVEPQADGSILVGSSSDPLKTYTLTGQACTCQDFARGQAPEGWCQHRIAAGIAKRVGVLLTAPVPVEPETVSEPWPDKDFEEPAPPASPAVPPALPEAPASCNVSVLIGGHKVQVTLRDSDEHRMLERLAALLTQFPAPASPQVDTTPQCEAHGALKKSTKGKGWYCAHKLDDGSWCKSKAK